ncbi:hypothetical protein ACFQO7_22370 [Catellatospora aurea]|uniref:Uncharacterized protein n=1 Tax=Catellatospora aurea TaxID=1337874 RepID=A0ABW2H036_9ACTN
MRQTWALNASGLVDVEDVLDGDGTRRELSDGEFHVGRCGKADVELAAAGGSMFPPGALLLVIARGDTTGTDRLCSDVTAGLVQERHA